MILNDEKSEAIIAHGMSGTRTFQIKASAKAFRILSGFYTDPVGAIPRELGANAWDAHVASGNTDKKFIVHCPNILEPWFSIRDFGTGLSKDAVYNIYTTYFESTKTTDNNSDGCMGLGSKTPFNYTDNFIVASYVNGVKYVFNCFVNEHSQPSVALMAEEETSDQNGLEIKIAVASDDIRTWREKIISAYTPFKNKPEIVGDDIVFEEKKYLYSGIGWAITDSDSRYYYSSNLKNWYIYMGNYRYNIDFSKIESSSFYSSLGSADQDKIYTIIRTYCGYFDVNIGDVDVAPNKETLQYNKNDVTSKKVCEMLLRIHSELAKSISGEIIKTINTSSSRISILKEFVKGADACRSVSSIYKEVSALLTNHIDLKKYNGLRSSDINSVVESCQRGIALSYYLVDSNVVSQDEKTLVCTPSLDTLIDLVIVSGYRLYHSTSIDKFKKYTFLLNRQRNISDFIYKFDAKLTFLYDSNPSKSTNKKICKWVSTHESEHSTNEILFVNNGMNLIQDFANYFGFDASFIDITNETPDVLIRKINRRTIDNIEAIKDGECIGPVKLEIDPTKKYFYIPTASGRAYYETTKDVVATDGTTTTETVRKYIVGTYYNITKCAIGCDIISNDDLVYILPKSLQSTVLSSGAKMISVFDALRKKLLKKKHLDEYLKYLNINQAREYRSLIALMEKVNDDMHTATAYPDCIDKTVVDKMAETQKALVDVFNSVTPSEAIRGQLQKYAECLFDNSEAFGYEKSSAIDSSPLDTLVACVKNFEKNNPNYSLRDTYYFRYLDDGLKTASFTILYSNTKSNKIILQ